MRAWAPTRHPCRSVPSPADTRLRRTAAAKRRRAPCAARSNLRTCPDTSPSDVCCVSLDARLARAVRYVCARPVVAAPGAGEMMALTQARGNPAGRRAAVDRHGAFHAVAFDFAEVFAVALRVAHGEAHLGARQPGLRSEEH